MLLASGQARTLPPSPGLRPSKCLGTESDAIETAPARLTHKMPLLPQPNCQRTPKTASNQRKQLSLSVRQGTNSPAKKAPENASPIKLYLVDRPSHTVNSPSLTDELLSIPVPRCAVKGQTLESLQLSLPAGTCPLQEKGLLSRVSQLYRTAVRRQDSPKRAAMFEA